MNIRINGTDVGCMPCVDKCNCEKGDSAMVFVHKQMLTSVYNADEAFSAGTLFPELRKPFLAGGC